MKVILLGICTLLLILPGSLSFSPVVIRSCVRQTKIKSVDLALFYGTLYDHVTKSTKCYLTCLFESTGVIIHGEVNKDLIEMSKNRESTAAKVNHMLDLVDACQDVKVAGQCEEGLAIFQCIINYSKRTSVDPKDE